MGGDGIFQELTMVDGKITEGWVVGGGMVSSMIEESGRID